MVHVHRSVARSTYTRIGAGSRDRATALTGAHILVVDDDSDMQRLLSLVFSKAGAIVLPTGSAAGAIEAFDDFQPRLVVSDFELPELDGLGLIRLIRSLSSGDGGKTPAIMLTGDSSGTLRRKALGAGFDALLCKPVAADKLLDASDALLSLRSQRE
jgi:CheY-like chemotaxis protein